MNWLAVIACAFCIAAAVLLLSRLPWPVCSAASPHGVRIGSVIPVEGCP
jgi:hypothetical protein